MSVKWRKADHQAAKAWAIIPMPPIMGMINTTSPQNQSAALACWALHTLMKDNLVIDTLDEIEEWLAEQ